MKIKHLGMEITPVPGTELITVEPSEGSVGGVHVVVTLHGVRPISFGVQELGEFIGALEVAHRHARFMIEQNGTDDE
jgi:hypothetical protein